MASAMCDLVMSAGTTILSVSPLAIVIDAAEITRTQFGRGPPVRSGSPTGPPARLY